MIENLLCYKCKNVEFWYDGDGFHEPRIQEMDCKQSRGDDSPLEIALLEVMDGHRDKCPLFTASCSKCERTLTPETVDWVESSYESLMVCSKCKPIVQKEVDAHFKELAGHSVRYD